MKKTRASLLAAFALLALSLLSACSSTPTAPATAATARKIADAPLEPVAWTQLGPEGSLSARVITSAAGCPHLRLNSSKSELTMSVRAQPNEAFPVLSCEASIPAGTRSVQLGEQQLPLPARQPRKILFIGDTGCRIQVKDGKTVAQACNDAQAWPFPTLAKEEAAFEPDLVVHLGDYLYREVPCPPGNTQCANSPSGNSWETWNADFFAAAQPLLRKAPWVFVRGNHELCKRAGEGWFRFLDSAPMHACTDDTAPFLVKNGRVELVVLDSALASDLKAPDDQVQIYQREFQAIAAMKLNHAWLVTHRPLWAPVLSDQKDPKSPVLAYNMTMQAACQNQLPSTIDEVFSGHLHLFEEFHFADGRPSQIVAGNGGTSLTPSGLPDPQGIEFAGTTVTSGTTLNDFGYFTLATGKHGLWEGTAHDSQGHARLYCRGLSGKAGLHCTPAH